MQSEGWQKIEELFLSALDREPGKRAAFLDDACGGDESLRKEVEALLASDQQAADFIEAPALELAAELFADDESESMVGRIIGPYRITSEIDHGGMGAVYLADRCDGQYEKQVAIKLVKQGLAGRHMTRRFYSERQILASLDHPHIAHLLDGGTTEDGCPYYVMEYIKGQPIDEYCDSNELTIDERLRLFRSVCSAVHYAHQNSVIHRDIKPGNILVTDEGTPRLLDFGIAKLLDPEPSLVPLDHTATVLRMMTPHYASPEQIRGEPVTAASDIYSLGIVLYELLTHHRPYRLTSRAPHDIARAICEQEPERPSSVATLEPNETGAEDSARAAPASESAGEPQEGEPKRWRKRLRGDLDEIVLKAIRKEPDLRYASVEQLSEDIRRNLEGLPVMACRGTLLYRGRKFIKRHNPGVAATLVTAFLILLGGLIGARLHLGTWNFPARARSGEEVRSIAVLPFANASKDPGNDYLSDGLSESLIYHLSQLPELKVIARSSSFKFRGKETEPAEVARALGVQGILTGTVMQQGNHLLVSAELVNASDQTQVWGDRYDRPMTDLLVVQGEIAREITENLRLRLGSVDEQRLTHHETVDPVAYDLLLRARFSRSKGSSEGGKKALEYYREAIAHDSDYALAYAELADAYTFLAGNSALDPAEASSQAEKAAMRAVELDPGLAAAYSSLAFIKLNRWEWEEAGREFKQAIELNPNYPAAHDGYADYLLVVGRYEEAIAEKKRARDLDPFSLTRNAQVSFGLYLARRYDEVIEECKRTLDLDRNYPNTHVHLAAAYMWKGMYSNAIDEFREAIRLGAPRTSVLIDLGSTFARAGQREQAEAILKELKTTKEYVSPAEMAILYAGLGDKERALSALEKGYAAHDPQMFFLRNDQFYDSLQSEPRFRDLLKKVGLAR